MKINNYVISLLDNHKGYGLIMMTMDISFSAAREWVKSNSDNLTKAAMLKAIRDNYGLQDSEILEEDTADEPKNYEVKTKATSDN